MNDSQFATFLEEIRGPRAFDADPARVNAITPILGLDRDVDAAVLLAGCEFLYDRAQEWATKNRDAAEVARDLIHFAGLWPRTGEDSNVVVERLAAVLRRNPTRDKELKRRWLRTGILDIATAFASFVDLRPNFNDDRSDITELVPVVIFNIIVQTEDGNDRSYVFQLSDDSLRQMERALGDVRTKLERVNTHERLATMISHSDEFENE